MARRVKFDGKVYKQTKFGEGLQPGTVEWEQRKRQERADDREYRAMLKKTENRKRRPRSDLPRPPQFILFRAIGSLIRLLGADTRYPNSPAWLARSQTSPRIGSQRSGVLLFTLPTAFGTFHAFISSAG